MPRDIIEPPAASRPANAEPPVARVREMLAIYEELNERERDDLIADYRSMTPVEVAILNSDEGVALSFERFRADHKSAFRVPFKQYAALLALGFVGLMICVYAVVSGF